jgi:hypothetical protein
MARVGEGRREGEGGRVIANFVGHVAVTMAAAGWPASSNQGSLLALSAWTLEVELSAVVWRKSG